MLCSAPTNLVPPPNNMKVSVKSHNEEIQDDNHPNQLSLGDRMDFKELLLSNWCKVHDSSHSEFKCCLCQIDVDHIKRKITPKDILREQQD